MNKIIDYLPFLSRAALRRLPSPIREIQPLVKLPGMISLGGGMPNSSLFPFSSFSFQLKDGSSLQISGERLDAALQYSSSFGLPELVDWLKKFQEREHHLTENGVPEWDVCVTTGSQDGLAKAFDLFLNEGDYIITENPTYSGSLSAMLPIGAQLVGINTDRKGMLPEHLEAVLRDWNFEQKRLKVIYLIPTGQNPSGSTMDLERKKRIYEIASKYNLIILEDDPYFHLSLLPNKETKGKVDSPPSFMSFDKEGRVLRFDSFSKILSSGIRIGWVTGPKLLVEKIQLHQQVSVLHTSGISQAIVLALLEKWGMEGFDKQKEVIQGFYTSQRDALIESAEKHLKGLAEWEVPVAGMFLWIRLIGVEDTFDLIRKKAVTEKVLFVPGRSFVPGGANSPFVRASFSTATPQQMEIAMSRLANLLKNNQ